MNTVEVGPDVRLDALQSLVAPRGIVVVGASRDPDKLGGAMAARLEGFPGPVALVNTRSGDGMHTSVAAAVADVATRGGTADLAVLCVPAAATPEVVAECGRLGIGGALVCAGGFGETGSLGAAIEAELLDAARTHHVRVVGPNTSGFLVPGRGLLASFVPGVSSIRPGSVAVVAASGGLHHALVFALERAGVGVSLGIGIGAGLDVTAVDVLRHLADDPDTSAVALHLESVPDGPALLAAVRTVSARKPVVALVVGQHDVGAFAESHTGALATSWRTTRALLRQAGAVLVERADDLVVAVTALSQVRLAAGHTGVGLVTAQAGPGLLIADAFHGARVPMPSLGRSTLQRLGELLPPMTYQANPVDTGRPGPRHSEVLSAVADDAAIDLVALYGLLEPVVNLPGAASTLRRSGRAVILGVDGSTTQVAAAVKAARVAGVTTVVGAQALACAVAAVVDDARALRATPGAALPARPVPDPGAGPWNEATAKGLLERMGIDMLPRRLCHDRTAAHEAFDALGGPVVAKVCSAAILHKSDVGGVYVGIGSHDQLDRALDALETLGYPVLLETMADSGVDLVAGARRDPVFGPIVVLGIRGVATEVYADVAIAAVPASREALLALPEQLAGRAQLEGFRGQPAVDAGRLADVFDALGALLLAHDHLTDVEINPLRCTSDRLVALDAVLVARKD